MRVCVFGNSHIAAMHLGWKLVSASHPQIEFVFFGAPKLDMTGVDFVKSTLVATEQRVATNFQRTGGSDRISLTDYDAFVIVGCDISLLRCYRELGPARLHAPRPADNQYVARKKNSAALNAAGRSPASLTGRLRTAVANWLPGIFGIEARPRDAELSDDRQTHSPRARTAGPARRRIVSRTFMTSAVEQIVRESQIYYFVEHISSDMDIPLFLIASPHTSSISLARNPKHKLAQTVTNGWNASFAEVFWNGLTAALAGKAIVIRQPEETVVDHVFTKEKYGLIRRGTNAEKQEIEMHDDVHMNAAFGAIVMHDLAVRIVARVGVQSDATVAVA